MSRLDTLLALHDAHSSSPWRDVHTRDAMRHLEAAAGSSSDVPLPTELPGDVVLRFLAAANLDASRVSRSALASVIVDSGGSRGLPSLTPSSRVSTSALVLFLCALCDGSFEAKLDACFSAADVDRIGRLSEAQTVSLFDANAALVVSALASSANPGAPVDAEWIGTAWREATRRRFRDEPTRPLDRERFGALAARAVDAVSVAAMDESAARSSGASAHQGLDLEMSDFESADESGNEGGHDLKESSNAFAEVLANLGLAPAAAEKKGHRRDASGGSGKGGQDRAGSLPGTATRHRHRRAQSSFGGKGDKAGGESVLWNMFASITSGYEKARSKTVGNEAELHAAGGAPAGSGSPPRERSTASPGRGAFGSSVPRASKLRRVASASDRVDKMAEMASRLENAEGSGAFGTPIPRTPRTAPGTPERAIATTAKKSAKKGVVGGSEPKASEGDAVTASRSPSRVPSRPAPASDETDVEAGVVPESSSQTPKSSKSELRREELRAALADAKEESAMAGEEQEEEDATFESAIAFAQEVGVRMFLYNIVKMLLIIAVIAADASVCVWTMFHFGIVIGLSLVMVINFALAILFGFFVLRYTKREKGMMHMEYGQHMMKGMTNLIDKNALTSLGEQLAALNLAATGAKENKLSRRSSSRAIRDMEYDDDYDSANGRGRGDDAV